MSSEVALRSIVVVALAYLGSLAGSADLRTQLIKDSSKQKALAVRCVNENPNNQQLGMSDARILAVSSRAGAECLSSSSKLHAIDVHMSALQQIVKLRGGFSNLTFQLQLWMTMIDIRTSFSTMSSTRFPAMSTRTIRQSTAYTLPCTSSPSDSPIAIPCSGFLTKHALLELPITLLNTLRELHEVTALWEQCRFRGPSISPSVMMSISVREMAIENALLNSPSDPATLASVCRLGALIFAETGLICVSRGANHLVEPMRALWAEAQRMRPCKFDTLTRNTVCGLLLSILFLGAHISAGHPIEEAGFAARICRLTTVASAHTWDEIEGHMKPWFYEESMNSVAFRAIWEEARTGGMMAIPHIMCEKDDEQQAAREVAKQAGDSRWEQQLGAKRRKLSIPFLI